MNPCPPHHPAATLGRATGTRPRCLRPAGAPDPQRLRQCSPIQLSSPSLPGPCCTSSMPLADASQKSKQAPRPPSPAPRHDLSPCSLPRWLSSCYLSTPLTCGARLGTHRQRPGSGRGRTVPELSVLGVTEGSSPGHGQPGLGRQYAPLLPSYQIAQKELAARAGTPLDIKVVHLPRSPVGRLDADLPPTADTCCAGVRACCRRARNWPANVSQP